MRTIDALELLRELRAGPYRARGGRQALADDLGVPIRRLISWLTGQARPTYAGEQQIRRLWEAHGLHEPSVAPDHTGNAPASTQPSQAR